MNLDISGKEARLSKLVSIRRAARPTGHFRLSDFHDGFYECDFVSPWTKSANNLNADIMLVAQDWASSEFLSREKDYRIAKLGHDEALPTNRNLAHLLSKYFQISFRDTYATNLFPFIKPGAMNASIKPRSLLRECAKTYLIPQIEIVQPKMVICLGGLAFEILRTVLGLPPLKGVEQTAKPGGHTKIGSSEIYGVAHTGQLGMNNRGRLNVERDWAGLAAHLQTI
jgi:restriction system protein